jgi:hypothetical protein
MRRSDSFALSLTRLGRFTLMLSTSLFLAIVNPPQAMLSIVAISHQEGKRLGGSERLRASAYTD